MTHSARIKTMALEIISKQLFKHNFVSSLKKSFPVCYTHSSSDLIKKESKHNAQNYQPIPVVIKKGKGSYVWDVEDRKYLDFLAGYATLNLGHAHPEILEVLKEQAGILSHTSRAFFNNILPEFVEYITNYFNYDRVLPMNTGVEGGETAVKIARRWGYRVKKIPSNKAVVVFVRNNFWGRTLSAVSSSTNPTAYEDFGPYMPGFTLIPYDDTAALQEALSNPNVCAFMMEPIQGEAGVIVPKDGYLKEVRRLCDEHNVLWIADEIQTGLGRTGRLLAVDHEEVRPDILIIGKGLAGGFVPMSAVLANDNVMNVITPGSHGSTFGGNPLATRLAITTLRLLKEGAIDNAAVMGEKFRRELRNNLPKDVIPIVRGRGMMNAICVNPDYGTPWDLCLELKDQGLLSKPCDGNAMRFTPPINMNEIELQEGLEMIYKAVKEFSSTKMQRRA
uniref:Ornithine aminotransferase n=1 Tax=Riptortus pedestris TaxID=329032 RepID=R4WTJ0_RIPPE|nr:ornithine aminotransferase [Riptortus pedestris]